MKTQNEISKVTSHLLMAMLAAMIIYMFTFPMQVQAGNNPEKSLPTLKEFIAQVSDGDADVLRGAYIPGLLALPVVQQPHENSNYVSPMRSELTEFNMADKVGNVGLLAHNYLAGSLFFEIQPDDLIILVYGDGHIETFVTTGIHRYEVLPDSEYKNIETEDILNIGEIFKVMYTGDRHVTLQTCMAKDKDLNWGRLFITATALDSQQAQEALPAIVVAPPPPPMMVLGWPLTQLRSSAQPSQPITP